MRPVCAAILIDARMVSRQAAQGPWAPRERLV